MHFSILPESRNSYPGKFIKGGMSKGEERKGKKKASRIIYSALVLYKHTFLEDSISYKLHLFDGYL